MITTLSRNWWTLLLRGLAAVVFGVLAFVWPDVTFTVLVLFFGAYALWDGIFALIGAFRTQSERRWPLVLEGLLGIAAGLFTFFWPGAATLAILFVIGAWAVLTGVFEIMTAIRLREELEGEWLMMIGGLLSVLFGIALFVWPSAGMLAITWLIGSYALLFGILLIVLGFRLRKWNERQPMAA